MGLRAEQSWCQELGASGGSWHPPNPCTALSEPPPLWSSHSLLFAVTWVPWREGTVCLPACRAQALGQGFCGVWKVGRADNEGLCWKLTPWGRGGPSTPKLRPRGQGRPQGCKPGGGGGGAQCSDAGEGGWTCWVSQAPDWEQEAWAEPRRQDLHAVRARGL